MVDLVQLKNELMPGIEELINKVLESKDETARKKALESAFEQANQKLTDASNKIGELNELVLSKDGEVDSLKEIIDNLKKEKASELEAKDNDVSAKVKEFEVSVSAKDEEIENLKKELAAAKETLVNIERDKLASERIDALKKEGVAYAKEEALKAQTLKVRSMSQEEFDSYRTELVELATQLKEVAGKEDAKPEGTSAVVPPPEVPKEVERVAALNVEVARIDDKFAGLGAALSKKLRELKEAKEI